jgi:hypothetical protein
MTTDPPDDREPYAWLPPDARPSPPPNPWKPAIAGLGVAVVLVVAGFLLAAVAVSLVVSAFGNFTLFPNK